MAKTGTLFFNNTELQGEFRQEQAGNAATLAAYIRKTHGNGDAVTFHTEDGRALLLFPGMPMAFLEDAAPAPTA